MSKEILKKYEGTDNKGWIPEPNGGLISKSRSSYAQCIP